MKETITKDTRRPGESQLDFLWSNYGNRPVASDTKNPDAIPSMGLLNRLLQLLKEEAVGSVVREGSFVVIRSVDGVEMGRFDIKELQGVYSVVDFGHRVVTEDDIAAGCKYDLYTPVYYITLDNGQTFWVPSEAYFGDETGGIKTTVQDRRIISYLKFDPNSSIAFKDDEGLFGEIRLDSEDATIRFDMVSMQTYLSITPKENTVYFIKNRPYFFFNGFRIGTESESDVTQLIKEAKEEIYKHLKAEHERAFKSEATLEVMVRSNHHAIEKLHHILHKITEDLDSGDYPKYTYFEYNGELRKTLVLPPNATISGESEKGGSQLLMVKDYDGVEVPVVEVGGQKAALVLNTCEDRVKVEVVEEGKRVQHSIATLDDLLAFADKIQTDTLCELIRNGISMALSKDLTSDDTLGLVNKSVQELDFNEKIVTIVPKVSLFGIWAGENGTYSFKNGEVRCGGSAQVGLALVNGSKVTIDNMTIKEAVYPFLVNSGESTLTIKSGAFSSNDEASPTIKVINGGFVLIEGGEFGASDVENGSLFAIDDSAKDGKNPKEVILVKGGKFWNFDPANNEVAGPGTNFVADGYKSVKTDNYYEVMPKTSEELGTELIADLKKGGDVKLAADAVVEAQLQFYKSGSLDLNGKTVTSELSGKDGLLITESSAEANPQVVVKNGTLISTSDNDAYGVVTVQKNPSLTLEDVKVTGKNPVMMYSTGSGTITINSGEFIGTGAQAVYYYKGAGKVVINGGEFKSEPYDGKYYTLNIYDQNRPADVRDAIEVRGGRFYKFNPADNITEGEHTNYVAEGFTVRQDGDWYEVIPVTD